MVDEMEEEDLVGNVIDKKKKQKELEKMGKAEGSAVGTEIPKDVEIQIHCEKIGERQVIPLTKVTRLHEETGEVELGEDEVGKIMEKKGKRAGKPERKVGFYRTGFDDDSEPFKWIMNLAPKQTIDAFFEEIPYANSYQGQKRSKLASGFFLTAVNVFLLVNLFFGVQLSPDLVDNVPFMSGMFLTIGVSTTGFLMQRWYAKNNQMNRLTLCCYDHTMGNNIHLALAPGKYLQEQISAVWGEMSESVAKAIHELSEAFDEQLTKQEKTIKRLNHKLRNYDREHTFKRINALGRSIGFGYEKAKQEKTYLWLVILLAVVGWLLFILSVAGLMG